MKLLLLSGGRYKGQGFATYARDWVLSHFDASKPIMFVPYACQDHDDYEKYVADAFKTLDLEIISCHKYDHKELLGKVGGVFVGGGNSFRLVDQLQRTGLINLIDEAVRDGLPYMGASAGSNVAAPTIMTTNDMPIIQPASFNAFGFTSFQINPHYLDVNPDDADVIKQVAAKYDVADLDKIYAAIKEVIPSLNHFGETREERIIEFHEENDIPIIGLREGTAVRVIGSKVELLGERTARLFRKGQAPEEVAAGDLSL